MAQRITLRSRTSVKILQKALARATDEAHKTRIRAIINIAKGASNADITRLFCVSPDTVTKWVKTYNTGGTKALHYSTGGRPKGKKKWDDAIFKTLTKEINKGGTYWSVSRMAEWIQEHTQKNIPESTIWYRITTLGYSHKSSRPTPVKGDKKAQEMFKKGAL